MNTLEQAAKARKTVHRMFKKLGLDGEYIYNPTAMLVARNAFKAGAEWQKEQKPLKYFPKEKVYDIMSKLTSLSFSPHIPINSDEYKKINEITSDVRDLLDYSIGNPEKATPVK